MLYFEISQIIHDGGIEVFKETIYLKVSQKPQRIFEKIFW